MGYYEDHPQHIDGSNMDRGIAYDDAWQHYYIRLALQLARWYTTPQVEVLRKFMALLAAEWRGILDWTWNYKIPVVFDNIILTKILSVCQVIDIQYMLSQIMDLWERGIHAGLMGDMGTEGVAHEGWAAQKEEDEEDLSWAFHSTALFKKLCHYVQR